MRCTASSTRLAAGKIVEIYSKFQKNGEKNPWRPQKVAVYRLSHTGRYLMHFEPFSVLTDTGYTGYLIWLEMADFSLILLI